MKKFIIGCLCLVSFLGACELEDLDKVDLLNLPTGGYMRNIVPRHATLGAPHIGTLTFSLAALNAGKIDFTVEAVTAEKGTQFASYDLAVEFRDRTAANGNNTKPLKTLKSIPSSSYSPDATSGYPRASFVVTSTEIMTALGVTAAEVSTGDSFEITSTMVMKDGKKYSIINTDVNITGGAAYNSPFFYRINVVN